MKILRWVLMLAVFGSMPLAQAAGIDDVIAGVTANERGDYDEAIRLVTKAITSGELSTGQQVVAFEIRGNVWRNKKDYDRAISDYNEAIRLNPQLNPQYGPFSSRGRARFYQGQFALAAADLAQSPLKPLHTYTALWLYLARSRGGANNARAELAVNTDGINPDWPAPVVALYLGKSNPAAVTKAAVHTNPTIHKKRLCEANFHVGEWHLLKGEKTQARSLFSKVESGCPPGFEEYHGAVAELKRLSGTAESSKIGATSPVQANWSGTVTLNFDSIAGTGCIDATSYLGRFGVTVTQQSSGTIVSTGGVGQCFHGDVVVPSSPNALYVLNNQPVSFSLNFDRALGSIRFVRARLNAGSSGVNTAGWTATAYSATGAKLAQVGEDAKYAYSPNFIVAAAYTLSGNGIRSVAFVRTDPSGQNTSFGVSFPVLDDFVLTAEVADPCETALKPLDDRFMTIFNLTTGYREDAIKNKNTETRTVFCRENPNFSKEIRLILSDFEKLKAADSGQCVASGAWKKFQSDMEGTLKGSNDVQFTVCGK